MIDASTHPGYMRNSMGHLVPDDQVREHDRLRDDVVRSLVMEAAELNQKLRAFKARALADMADLVNISGARYGISIGGQKGNLSLATYDGAYKVVRSCANRVSFTEELEVAKELINQCITRWSEGANQNIRALVDRAFRTNAQGQLRTAAVLDLLRLEINDDGWKLAMRALSDSIMSTGTAIYVRVYRRVGSGDNYEQLPLDLASV